MKVEQQMNQIYSYFHELQKDADSLSESINSVKFDNDSFKDYSTDNDDVDVIMKEPLLNLTDVILEKHKQTEVFIENALDPERMDQIMDFFHIMNETMKDMEN